MAKQTRQDFVVETLASAAFLKEAIRFMRRNFTSVHFPTVSAADVWKGVEVLICGKHEGVD